MPRSPQLKQAGLAADCGLQTPVGPPGQLVGSPSAQVQRPVGPPLTRHDSRLVGVLQMLRWPLKPFPGGNGGGVRHSLPPQVTTDGEHLPQAVWSRQNPLSSPPPEQKTFPHWEQLSKLGSRQRLTALQQPFLLVQSLAVPEVSQVQRAFGPEPLQVSPGPQQLPPQLAPGQV